MDLWCVTPFKGLTATVRGSKLTGKAKRMLGLNLGQPPRHLTRHCQCGIARKELVTDKFILQEHLPKPSVWCAERATIRFRDNISLANAFEVGSNRSYLKVGFEVSRSSAINLSLFAKPIDSASVSTPLILITFKFIIMAEKPTLVLVPGAWHRFVRSVYSFVTFERGELSQQYFQAVLISHFLSLTHSLYASKYTSQHKKSPETWNKVVPPLEAHGFTCVLVTLPSTLSDSTTTFNEDITAVRTAILSETKRGHDVVVVMHSYGGAVGVSAIKG